MKRSGLYSSKIRSKANRSKTKTFIAYPQRPKQSFGHARPRFVKCAARRAAMCACIAATGGARNWATARRRPDHREENMRIWLTGLAVLASLISPASADDRWPQRQVNIIVPFTAGGTTDLFA